MTTLAPAAPGALAPPAQPRLHLGCGRKILDGYVNVDIVAGPGVDLVCDVSQGVPFPDNSFDEVLAVDFIEHIPTTRAIAVMNDIWRVMRPGGVFKIHVPAAPGITAFQDPTHVSYWNEESFTYYEDGHRRREQYGVYYGIQARFRRRKLRRRRNLWTRFFVTFDFNYLANFVLDIELEAIK
jgi:predicted SAM-dependent methyltransferase